MSYYNAPHFGFPFHLDGNKFAEVEQDTPDDIYNCVYVALITPEGFRTEAPDFGMPDLTFMNQPIDPNLIMNSLLRDEPRASVILEQQPNAFDDLIAEVTLDFETGGPTQ